MVLKQRIPLCDMLWLWITLIVLCISIVLYLLWKKQKKKKRVKSKYPSFYNCLDGHRARSLSEVVVDNCLYRCGILHEEEGLIKKNGKKKYKYDWFLPECDVYLEFFGYFGKKYQDTRKKKEKYYKKHSLDMIAIEPQDLANIEESMRKKLKKHWDSITRSGTFCPNCGESLER